jgi:hypothetical protein
MTPFIKLDHPGQAEIDKFFKEQLKKEKKVKNELNRKTKTVHRSTVN